MNKDEKFEESALIFYRPATSKAKEQIFLNEQARRLTVCSRFLSDNPEAEKHDSIFSFWVELTDKKYAEASEEGTESAQTHFLDVVKSGKRRYLVKGGCLCALDSSRIEPKQYLFVLDRVGDALLNRKESPPLSLC